MILTFSLIFQRSYFQMAKEKAMALAVPSRDKYVHTKEEKVQGKKLFGKS